MSNLVLKDFLDPDIYEKFSNIKHKHIKSENPEDHWDLLTVENQIVLDLGCGFHMIEEGWQSTPEYFINKKAKKIIGVDAADKDIRKLKSLFHKHDFYHDIIDSVDKINNYIINNNITSLKMDIEGEEVHFINSENEFPTLKYVAIESHNKNLLNSLIVKLNNLKFNIDTVCTFYPRVYNICNLVYASR